MELITQHVCMAKDIGIHGNLFGEILLSWIDISGSIYAAQIIDSPRVVTLKIESLLFKEPIKAGHLIKIYGEVVKIGNTSITLNIEVVRHKPQTGKQKVACSTQIVFVHIDEDGEPTKIKRSIVKKYES